MVGIGFFAPLPLALMMPFMAGQSMLMGDAFGKAYQYGKRKISAMTNEEFNKLTPEQLGKEIATDYSAMIPSLQTAIKQSSDFQSLIIQELASIVRSLPKDIVSGFTGDSANPISTIQQQATQPAENVDYGKIAIATLKIMLGPIASNFNVPGFGTSEATSGEGFIGPPEPLPDTLQQHIDIQKDLGNLKTLTEPAPSLTKSETEAIAFTTWQGNLITLQKSFTASNKVYHEYYTKAQKAGNTGFATNTYLKAWSQMFDSQSKIKLYSQDYRNPNNGIRTAVLELRVQIQKGWWRRQRLHK